MSRRHTVETSLSATKWGRGKGTHCAAMGKGEVAKHLHWTATHLTRSSLRSDHPLPPQAGGEGRMGGGGT